MKSLVVIGLIALSLSGCSLRGSIPTPKTANRLSADQKHRLYAAALAASDSPMETDIFKDVCATIGIFDAKGEPNDGYIVFVSQHVDWATKSETDEFRGEINSRQKAREYIEKHLSAR